MKTENNVIVELTIEFSLLLIPYCELLDELKKYVISRQLLKAGTSVGANVHEAQSPESRMDFIHKMKIAAKEARETEYWLTLCSMSPSYPDCSHLLEKLEPITKILSSIISSSRSRMNR
jgi:four helix bundle protein